jgi:DNA-binding NtrC family response regulator
MAETVLVIDDEEGLRRMYRELLEERGYRVVTAENGDAGGELFRSEQPAVVILDIIMPEKEGVETMLDLKKHDPAVRVIAISGGGQVEAEEYLRIMRHFGARFTFQKPVGTRELLRAVDSLASEGGASAAEGD